MMLGSDPELFLKRDGSYVSAVGLIGGTKEHPKPVKSLGKGFYVQEDNVALEFNTPPTKNGSSWVKVHTNMLEYLSTYLKTKGLTYSIDASAVFPKEELLHPMAQAFGCEPDYNCWTLSLNPRPVAEDPFLRVCGAHVHVSFEGTNSDKIMLGRRMDALLGLWSVINDPDTRRRELYGKAGAIRFKPYGIEYRVLSNFWLKSSANMEMVWHLTETAIHNTMLSPPENVARAINSGDKDKAQALYSKYYGTW